MISGALLKPLAAAAAITAATLAAGCGSGPAAPQRPVEITGEIHLPPGAAAGGKVFVNLYHAWSLQGELRHPLQLIETFEAAPGAFRHAFDYPEQEGEGLIVYAWVDLDGDGVLCTPGYRLDLAGLTEVQGYPAGKVTANVDLAEPCRGPDWFYPRPVATGG